MAELIVIVGILAVFTIPISAIYLSHREKMARFEAERGTPLPPNVVAELQALRDEVATLRETTTRFDMSFDAAVTRLEDRMDRVEQRTDSLERAETRVTATPTEPNVLRVGNRPGSA